MDTTLILATEGGGLQLVLPAPAELVWGFIGFALLFAFLQWKAWPAINKTLEERRQAIQGQITDAEQQTAEAERLRREYEQSLSEARGKASQIIDEARSDAERVRADIVAKAEEEATAIRERARQEQEAERARLANELRGQVAALSVDLAAKIVGREVDQQRHDDLVQQYIDRLSGMN